MTYASKEYEIFKEHIHDIDIAFIDRYAYWAVDDPGMEIIRKYIKPKHVIISHVFYNDYEVIEEAMKDLKNEQYSVTFFKKPGDKKMFQVN